MNNIQVREGERYVESNGKEIMEIQAVGETNIMVEYLIEGIETVIPRDQFSTLLDCLFVRLG